MASEMLEKVLAAEKQSEAALVQAHKRATEIIAQAQAQADEALDKAKTACAKNSASAAAFSAEKCKEVEKREETGDAAIERELLAGASASRAKAEHAVRSKILTMG